MKLKYFNAHLTFFLLTIILFTFGCSKKSAHTYFSNNQIDITDTSVVTDSSKNQSNPVIVSDSANLFSEPLSHPVLPVKVIFFSPDFKEEYNHFSLGNRSLNGALIHTINTNIGDAILIITSDKTILIDAGLPGREKYLIMPYLKKINRDKIDLLVITHPHFDHYGGALYLLEKFNIDKVVVCGSPHPSNAYKYMLELIKVKNIKFEIPKELEKLDFGKEAEAIVLKSGVDEWEGDNNYNNQSIYIKMKIGKITVLFTGDGEYESENYILKKGYDVSADILKVAHHGSATSTFYPFLKSVNPKTAIISIGKNNIYGLPKQSVINRLILYGCKIYRTDDLGTISLSIDGDTYWIDSEKNGTIKYPEFNISSIDKDKYLEVESKGELALRKNDVESAIKYYKEAIRIFNQNATTYEKLGYAYRRNYEDKFAELNFKKALQLDDNEAFSHLYLGLYYIETNKNIAKMHLMKFKKILPISPVSRLVDEKLNYITTGKSELNENDYYDRY